MTKQKKEQISNCCNAPIKNNIPLEIDNKNRLTTNYYICTKCNKACDSHISYKKHKK